jgi:hypothetical protein
MVTVLGLIGVGIGIMMGISRFRTKKEDQKVEREKAGASKGRKSRIDMSEDAPAELTPAELKAMGSWFKE